MWHDDLDALAPVTKKVGGRRFGDDENWHVFTKHGEIDRHQEIFIESLEFYQLNQEILGFYRFKISKYWWILELSSKGQIVPSKYDQNEHEVVPQMGFWPFNIIDSWAGFTQSRCYQNGDLSNGNGSFVLPTKNLDFRLIWFHYQKWLFYRTKYWDLMEKCGKIMFCFFKFIPSGPPWSAHLHGEVILSGVSNCISDYRRVTVCNMFMVESCRIQLFWEWMVNLGLYIYYYIILYISWWRTGAEWVNGAGQWMGFILAIQLSLFTSILVAYESIPINRV